MSPYDIDAVAWQESWDRQQEAFLPDREERFSSMLDAVEAVAGPVPRVLDLAGGTGSLSLRVLRRFPQARTTLVDVDPVLLAIARASLDERSVVARADLRTPDWVDASRSATSTRCSPRRRCTGCRPTGSPPSTARSGRCCGRVACSSTPTTCPTAGCPA
jgi:Methyltransferase domain